MIQLTNIEIPMCSQILRSEKTRLIVSRATAGRSTHRSDVYETRQRMGHIMIKRPIAIGRET